MKKAEQKTKADINNTQYLFLSRVNVNKKKDKITIAITITSCPISRPKLKEINGKKTLSCLAKSDFNRYEKPMPCTNPNIKANPKLNDFTSSISFVKLSIFKIQVIKIVRGIITSMTPCFMCIILKTLAANVNECPIVKAVISVNNCFHSL